MEVIEVTLLFYKAMEAFKKDAERQKQEIQQTESCNLKEKKLTHGSAVILCHPLWMIFLKFESIMNANKYELIQIFIDAAGQ